VKNSGQFLAEIDTFPIFTSFDTPPEAGGHMLTEPWHRVGHPPQFITL
jgi:hypothetical protein